MAHRIFVGPCAALEERWIKEILRLQEGNPLQPVCVLVGSNLLAVYLRRRVAECGHPVANLRFYTFVDLAALLAECDATPGRKPRLPRLGASLVLQSILREHVPAVFSPVSAFPGFLEALLDTFRDLRDAGITPEALQDSMRPWLDEAADRTPFLDGLAETFRRFRRKVTLFEDVDDDFRTAIINAGRARAVFGCPCLLVYGIYDITGQQELLLDALRKALDMVYWVPFINDEVSGFARPFLEHVERTLGVGRESLEAMPQGTALSHLWRSDFGLSEKAARDGRSTPDRNDGSCTMVSAPGDSRTAIEIVREILRALRDGVIRGFHEAAVLFRHSEEDLPLVTEALRLRGIPYFIHGGSSFSARPLSRAVAAICALQQESFTRQAILSAVELISASASADEQANWDAPGWRALTNQPGFLAGLEAWDAGTEALVRESGRTLHAAEAAGTEDSAGGPSAAALRARLGAAKALCSGWRALRWSAADWPDAFSWQDWARLLQQHLEPLFGSCGDWPAFLNVLDELAALNQMAGTAGLNVQVPRAEMSSALAELLSAHKCPEGKFQRRGVNLLSISAARGLRFPLVIVPGLDEGRFPARLRQDPLLLDVERERIRAAGKLPLKSRRADEEKLLFDLAARSASRRLVLITSRLDEGSDRERIPSRFFLQAAGALCGRDLSLRDFARGWIPGFRSVGLENPSPRQDEVAVDEGEIRLRLITAEQHSSQAALESLAAVHPQLLKGPMAYDRARWMRKLTEFDGCFSDAEMIRWIAAAAGPAAGPVSASRLEDYARCPYRFYLKRLAGLEEWQEQEAAWQMNPLERGRAIHGVLEHFFQNLPAGTFLSASVEELWTLLRQRAWEALEEARPAGIADLLWDIEREQLLRMLQGWLKFEKVRVQEDWEPSRFEHVFGDFGAGEKGISLRIPAGRNTLDFRGRIDRIDFAAGGRGARVIDYKIGVLPESMQKNRATPLMCGERMQLAIYAQAVLSEFPGIETAEGEYLHLQPRDGAILTCSFNDARLRQAVQSLPGTLELIMDGITGGIFFDRAQGSVRPFGHCDYCEYLPVCGKDRVRRQERKAGDAAVVQFQRLREIDDGPEEGK